MRHLPLIALLVFAGLPAAAQAPNHFLTTPQAEADFTAGYDSERGRGVAKDFARALEFYRKAVAEAGHPIAKFRIGYLYEQGGPGVPQDYAKAMESYRAAAQNAPQARFRIGYLYEQGLGVPRDYAQARDWYEQAKTEPAAAQRLARLPPATPR